MATSTHPHRWSARVARESDALTLEQGIFAKGDAKGIARSLKRSAMSMLNFFINRMGSQLKPTRRKVLERAKDELRALYGKAGPPKLVHAKAPARRHR